MAEKFIFILMVFLIAGCGKKSNKALFEAVDTVIESSLNDDNLLRVDDQQKLSVDEALNLMKKRPSEKSLEELLGQRITSTHTVIVGNCIAENTIKKTIVDADKINFLTYEEDLSSLICPDKKNSFANAPIIRLKRRSYISESLELIKKMKSSDIYMAKLDGNPILYLAGSETNNKRIRTEFAYELGHLAYFQTPVKSSRVVKEAKALTFHSLSTGVHEEDVNIKAIEWENLEVEEVEY